MSASEHFYSNIDKAMSSVTALQKDLVQALDWCEEEGKDHIRLIQELAYIVCRQIDKIAKTNEERHIVDSHLEAYKSMPDRLFGALVQAECLHEWDGATTGELSQTKAKCIKCGISFVEWFPF